MFPTGGDPMVLPQKINFPDGIKRGVLHKQKIVNCYRFKTWLRISRKQQARKLM